MTLRLRVPALSDVAHDSVETRRTFVEAWIESLPYGGAVHRTRRAQP